VRTVVVWLGGGDETVLQLAGPLRARERAQRLGAAGFLAGRIGEEGRHRISRPVSAGRLPPADLHHARSRHRGGESGERLARAARGGTAGALESKAVVERPRVPAAACAARALAWGYLLRKPGGQVLLPLQRAGWVQPLPGPLGVARIDEGSRSGNRFGAGAGEISPGAASHHQRQWAAVHRARLQGVLTALRHDARAHFVVLSAIEQQDRALASLAEGLMPTSGRARLDGGGVELAGELREPLQSRAAALGDRLRRAARHAGRAGRGDLGRARSEAGESPAATAASPSGSFAESSARTGEDRWRSAGSRIKLNALGETEVGNAGEQSRPGITRWTHRLDEVGSVRSASRWIHASVPNIVC